MSPLSEVHVLCVYRRSVYLCVTCRRLLSVQTGPLVFRFQFVCSFSFSFYYFKYFAFSFVLNIFCMCCEDMKVCASYEKFRITKGILSLV